jgi:hypothetical protein
MPRHASDDSGDSEYFRHHPLRLTKYPVGRETGLSCTIVEATDISKPIHWTCPLQTQKRFELMLASLGGITVCALASLAHTLIFPLPFSSTPPTLDPYVPSINPVLTNAEYVRIPPPLGRT